MTYEQVKRRRAKRLITCIFVLALAVVIASALVIAQASAREQAAASVRESVLNAAKQCCAVEGSYPSTLQYLEDNYGLTINHSDYVVSYEWFADNVLPAVVVVTR